MRKKLNVISIKTIYTNKKKNIKVNKKSNIATDKTLDVKKK